MKRYIISINGFEGLEIKRFDGWFKEPFVTRIAIDENGHLPTKTAIHLRILLRAMEKAEKADRVTPRPGPNSAQWVIDVIDGIPVGQYWPYGDRAQVMLPSTLTRLNRSGAQWTK